MKRREHKLLIRASMLLLAMLMVTGLVQNGFAAETDTEPVCYEHGDVNGDGKVDSRDAIHALYHSVDEEDPYYAVNQNIDFNGDGKKDSKDAVYILYSTFDLFKDAYKLNGHIHQYYEPVWTWNEDGTVQVLVKCGCGVETTHTAEVKETTTVATCTAAGSVVSTAKVTVGGEELTDTKTVVIPATGHAIDATVCDGGKCANCDYVEVGKGHTWVEDAENSTAATCTTNGVQVYKCVNEGCTSEPKEVELSKENAAHAFVLLDKTQGEGCTWMETYGCSVCENPEFSYTTEVQIHDYIAKVNKEATCSVPGEKIFVCSNSECDAVMVDENGDTVTVALENKDAHQWNGGEQVDDGMKYTCTVQDCGATKVVAAVTSDDAINKDVLTATDELKLDEGTAIQLDADTVNALDADKDIKLKVKTTDANSLENVDSELKSQIGENPVYDFSMVYVTDEGEDAGSVSQFSGTVTVSLPYTLAEGEDADSIEVWFINDEGEVEAVNGTYSNGFVTFTTNHFSYYTVTRLTPAQRCEKYGHVMQYLQKAATCTADGYDVAECRRCGYVEKDEVLPKLEHAYTETVVEATCETKGSFEKTCDNCEQKISGEIPALGHSWVLDEENSVTATCQNAGKEIYTCANCDGTYTTEIKQLEHTFEEDKKNADCTNKGHKKQKCIYCKYEYLESEDAPTGHDYKAENAVWTWSDDGASATVVLVCAYDEGHTKTLNAVVSEEPGATCSANVTYKAVATFNKAEFTDTKTVERDDADVVHTPGDKWLSNANQHYHECAVCQTKFDHADHSWGSVTVTKAATCVVDGTGIVACTVCGREKETVVPATGSHSFVSGKCTACGFEENTCKHMKVIARSVDLEGYDICEGAQVFTLGCECGLFNWQLMYSLNCHMVPYQDRVETMPDGTQVTYYGHICEDCGLTSEYGYYTTYFAEDCYTEQRQVMRLSLDGGVIALCDVVGYAAQHEICVHKETVDMGKLGLCAGTLTTNSCRCGERIYTYEDSGCFWVYNNQSGVSVCENCGAEKIVESSINKDPATCIETNTIKATYKLNGTVVHSHTNVEIYESHNIVVTDYTMEGDSCEDGFYVTRACRDCGMTFESYDTWHNTDIKRTEIDLSGKDICYDKLIQGECACGVQKGYWFESSSSCSWNWVESGENTETYRCSVCGATRVYTWTYGEKDANCQRSQINTYTFKDKSGKVLASAVESYTSTSHNYIYVPVLNAGATDCDGGYTVAQKCQDCDYVYENYTSGTGCNTNYPVKRTYYTDDKMCGVIDLRSYACACGRYQSTQWYWDRESCSFSSDVYDEELDTWIYKCQDCGLEYYDTTHYEKLDDPCLEKRVYRYTFSRDDKVVFTFDDVDVYDDHAYIYDLTLNEGATDCDGGYTVAQKCQNCDYVDEDYSSGTGCGTWIVKREYFTDDKMCGVIDLRSYACACGRYQSTEWYWDNESCNFSSDVYDEELDTWIYKCQDCGLEYYDTTHYEKLDDPCLEKRVYRYTFSRDGEVAFTFDDVDIYEDHDWIYEKTLIDASLGCDGGYTETVKCQNCDYSDAYDTVYTGHGTSTVKHEYFTDDKMCGVIDLRTYACACGRYQSTQWYWDNESCSFSSEVYDEELDTWIYKCQDCGLEYYDVTHYEKIDDPCLEKRVYRYTFSRDGKQVFTFDDVDINDDHDYLYTLTLNEGATDCDDGYSYVAKCADCDETYSNTGYYGCSWWNTYRETVYSDDKMCGPVYFYMDGCACGEYISGWFEDSCDWTHVGYENGRDIYVCDNCGAKRTSTHESYDRITGACDETVTLTRTYFREDEVLVEAKNSYSRKEHVYVYSYDLQGTSCEDGYYRTRSCVYCDKTRTDDSLYTGHGANLTAYYDLTEYGMCGGNLRQNSCACGLEMPYSSAQYDCNWTYTGKTDPDTGAAEYYCAICGTYRYEKDTGGINPETCRDERERAYRFVRDGETILEVILKTREQRHSYEVVSVQLTNPEGNCEDGYTANMKCKYCEESYTSTGSGHSTYVVESIDLKELNADLCGGHIQRYSCACGEETNVSYDFDCVYMDNYYTSVEGEDGYTHNTNKYSCPDCGLTYIRDQFQSRDYEKCMYTDHYDYTFYYGDTVIMEYAYENSWYSHDNEIVKCELREDAADCDDGIIITYHCKVCGAESEGWTSGHQVYAQDETINLKEYGAVCDTFLTKFACACGKHQEYQLTGDSDKCCDMDEQWAEDWVDGAIHDSQYTSEGHWGTYSYFYNVICAVTEPQCGVRLQHADYWLVDENCVATRYQNWKLGYDEATGTWAKDITIATGEKHAYHTYDTVYTTETAADGSYVDITAQTCTKCGSTYVEKYYYAADESQTKWEREAINTLNNGERKRWYEAYEYAYVISELRYITLDRWEYTYADGSTYWAQNAFTYDFTKGCFRTVAYTSSDGGYNTYSETYHNTANTYVNLKDATCTQFGEYKWVYTCQRCKTVTQEDTYRRNPTAHYWYQVEENLYQCSVCGLENVNGASGSIVLEDMTEETGDNYVVGYWNRGSDLDTVKYVSVVMDNVPDNVDPEILLDVTMTEMTEANDGINAICFNKADTLAAAKAALEEAGYTGTYAIRFTFVPKDSYNTLDYAITFDSLEA